MKIAIINDNKRIREILKMVLQEEGISYEEFETVNSFLERVFRAPREFSGMFLDMQLPEDENGEINKKELGGEKILRELLKENIKIPFVVCSTLLIDEDRRKKDIYCNMYGQIHFITKWTLQTILSFLRHSEKRD